MRLGEGKDFLLGKNRESGEQSCRLRLGLCSLQHPSHSMPIGAAVELSSALHICETEWLVTGGREFIS